MISLFVLYMMNLKATTAICTSLCHHIALLGKTKKELFRRVQKLENKTHDLGRHSNFLERFIYKLEESINKVGAKR